MGGKQKLQELVPSLNKLLEQYNLPKLQPDAIDTDTVAALRCFVLQVHQDADVSGGQGFNRLGPQSAACCRGTGRPGGQAGRRRSAAAPQHRAWAAADQRQSASERA